jgi:hypothetical protein
LEGSIHDAIKVLAWNFLGRTEESFETSVKIIIVLAEIQMEHLLDMNLEHYCYTALFCVKKFLLDKRLILTLHHSD